ncbi:MAG: alpha/beta fold hydrolase [Chloroflexi bacterium]|nr:alpha/beta fold hydrolase [Chloroflexota bacterium]
MRNYFPLIFFLLLVLPVRAQEARFEKLDRCPPWFRVDLLQIECGFLHVPEDRSHPDTNVIKLAVAIYRSGYNPDARDATVVLGGGPGGAVVGASGAMMGSGLGSFLRHGDVIFFDQRGTGFSEPSLECPEVDLGEAWQLARSLPLDEMVQKNTETARLCRDRLLKQGVNLSAYTSAASAADVADLADALGYEQVNLYGGSYGTRLALTIMRDYPAIVRSAILDSTLPVQANLYAEMGANVERVFDVLFDGCAGSEKCATAYPDLEVAFYDLIERLNAKPVIVPLANPLTGQISDVVFDGYRFGSVIFRSLYSTDTIPLLPRLINRAAAGDFSGLAQGAGLALYAFVSIADGVSYSVNCSEELPFYDLDAVRTANASLQPMVRDLINAQAAAVFNICAGWGAKPLTALENQPVTSDIPTLVLAGEYDPITPPAWGKQVAETLSHSYFYQFPGVGHGVVTASRCGARIAFAFLENPAVEPDAACITGMNPPRFR